MNFVIKELKLDVDTLTEIDHIAHVDLSTRQQTIERALRVYIGIWKTFNEDGAARVTLGKTSTPPRNIQQAIADQWQSGNPDSTPAAAADDDIPQWLIDLKPPPHGSEE